MRGYRTWAINEKLRQGWQCKDFNKKLPQYLLERLWFNSGTKRKPDLHRFENDVIYIGEVVYRAQISRNKYRDYAELAFQLADMGISVILIELDKHGKLSGAYDMVSVWYGLQSNKDMKDILLRAKITDGEGLLKRNMGMQEDYGIETDIRRLFYGVEKPVQCLQLSQEPVSQRQVQDNSRRWNTAAGSG